MFPWSDSFDAIAAQSSPVRRARPSSDPWQTSSKQVGHGLDWVPERERAMGTISARLGGTTAMSPPWDLDNVSGRALEPSNGRSPKVLPPIASVDSFNGVIIGGDGLGIALEDGSDSAPRPPPTVAAEVDQSASRAVAAPSDPHASSDTPPVARISDGAALTATTAATRTGSVAAFEARHVGKDITVQHSNNRTTTGSNIVTGSGRMTTTESGARRDTFIGGYSNTFVGEDTRSNLRLGVVTAQEAPHHDGGAHGSDLACLAAGSGSTVLSLPGEKSGRITAHDKVRKVSRDTLAVQGLAGERSNADAELGTTSKSMLRGSAIGTAAGAEPRDRAAAADTVLSHSRPAGGQRGARLTAYAATKPPMFAAAHEQDGFAQKLADLNRDIDMQLSPTPKARHDEMEMMQRLLLAKDAEIALLRARLEYTEHKLRSITHARV